MFVLSVICDTFETLANPSTIILNSGTKAFFILITLVFCAEASYSGSLDPSGVAI